MWIAFSSRVTQFVCMIKQLNYFYVFQMGDMMDGGNKVWNQDNIFWYYYKLSTIHKAYVEI